MSSNNSPAVTKPPAQPGDYGQKTMSSRQVGANLGRPARRRFAMSTPGKPQATLMAIMKISLFMLFTMLQNFLFLFTHIGNLFTKTRVTFYFRNKNNNKEVDILFYNIKPLIILTSLEAKDIFQDFFFPIFNRIKHQAYDFIHFKC